MAALNWHYLLYTTSSLSYILDHRSIGLYAAQDILEDMEVSKNAGENVRGSGGDVTATAGVAGNENPNSSVVSSRMASTSTYSYDIQEYEKKLQETLIPLPDSQVNTTNHIRQFMAGLCNQYQRFIGTILLAYKRGYGQIIEESITWKDTFGTDAFVKTSQLWDIVHWNSFYPVLPRFARFDKDIHTDLVLYTQKATIDGHLYEWNETRYDVAENHDIWKNVTHPPPLGQHPNQGEIQYRQLMKQIEFGVASKSRPEELEIYKTILKSALRPHPFLQGVIDQAADDLGGPNKKGYMVIHARVEPDMARQQVCTDKKVYYMDNITDMIYKQFPEPPVETVLLVFARALLERMEDKAKKKTDDGKALSSLEKVNRHNLQSIHHLIENGMWDGKVKVVEAGSQMVENAGDPFYKRFSNIAGGIVNFFLAVQSKILVGTEVSTFSTLSMNTRFYREQRENYFYRPEGLYWVTPPDAQKPHRFVC